MTRDRDNFDQLRTKVVSASWPEPLWHAFLQYFEQAGIARVMYHHIPPLGSPDEGRIRVVAQGYPEAWLADYIRSKTFLWDPLADQALSDGLPFAWSSLRQLRALGEREEDYLSELEAAGFANGLSVAAFGPGGRNGYLGLSLKSGEPFPGDETISEWAWACQMGHIHYCKLLQRSQPDIPQLTEREQEILGWVARGKSNGVIAEIMQLSPHTIDAHIRRVFLKLGASDRVSAAIRGLGAGLVRGR